MNVLEVFEPSSGSPAHVVESIVDFGKSMGLEVRDERWECAQWGSNSYIVSKPSS